MVLVRGTVSSCYRISHGQNICFGVCLSLSDFSDSVLFGVYLPTSLSNWSQNRCFTNILKSIVIICHRLNLAATRRFRLTPVSADWVTRSLCVSEVTRTTNFPL